MNSKQITLVAGAVVCMFMHTQAQAALIPLQNATATHQSATYQMTQSIDGTTTGENGWAPGSGNVDANPQIVFETVSDQLPGDYKFTFIHSSTANTQHTLARFRISATTDARSTFADGSVGGDITANWVELTPLTAVSQVSSGATFSIVGNEVRVSGTNPGTDTYDVTASIGLTDITGFRIETFSSASSPLGPGRASNRNFILTEFQVDQTSVALAPVPEPGSGLALLVMLGSCFVWKRR